jgi:CBS domain-containing protein
VPTIAGLVSVAEIMKRDITCARRDLDTNQLVALVVRNRIGCIPVVDESGRPVGMVTKLDLVERLLAVRGEAVNRGLAPRTADDVMMPLALTLGERATIAQAATLMANEDIHHLPICDEAGRMIGIVSTMDIVRWLATNDGLPRTD